MGGEIIFLTQKHGQSSAARVSSDAGSIDATTDNHKVVLVQNPLHKAILQQMDRPCARMLAPYPFPLDSLFIHSILVPQNASLY